MQRHRDNSEGINLWVPVLIVLVVVAALYLWQKDEEPADGAQVEQPVVPQEETQLPGEIVKPAIKYPVPETPAQIQKVEEVVPEPVEPPKPLPALDESDPVMQEELVRLYDQQKFGELFLFEAIVRHFVVTIDNMTGPKLPQRYVFTKPPTGKFAVRKDANDNEFLDPNNYKRYADFVKLAETVDTRKFVSLYVRYYPLLQKAYEELGYPGRYFNDRFIEVIDHLLVTPEFKGPVNLVRPKVYYQFADPDLEKFSAGQKILIRIGPDNAVKVKAKLRELRQTLTKLKK